MTELATTRLTARPCRPDDAGHVAALFADPAVHVWTSPPGIVWDGPRCERVALKLAGHWIAHGWGPRLWFAGDRLVGICGLQFAILDGRGAVELAYAVLPAAQGRGYASEAIAATLAEAPAIAAEIMASVVAGNDRSVRRLAAAGFRPAGQCEEDGRRFLLFRRRT
jgi:RimJ/RimL family protein N-acetyltransferase